MMRSAGVWLGAALVLCAGAVAAQDMYVYPAKNQTDEQMGRDKEECHDWAVKQTGVDPATLAAQATSPQKGGGAGGAVAGTEMGAGGSAARGAMSGDAAGGAVQGVGVGRLVHAVRARRQMEEHQEAAAQAQQQRQTQLGKYDRAYAACLTGRGYTVQ